MLLFSLLDTYSHMSLCEKKNAMINKLAHLLFLTAHTTPKPRESEFLCVKTDSMKPASWMKSLKSGGHLGLSVSPTRPSVPRSLPGLGGSQLCPPQCSDHKPGCRVDAWLSPMAVGQSVASPLKHVPIPCLPRCVPVQGPSKHLCPGCCRVFLTGPPFAFAVVCRRAPRVRPLLSTARRQCSCQRSHFKKQSRTRHSPIQALASARSLTQSKAREPLTAWPVGAALHPVP